MIETPRLHLRLWKLADANEAFGFYGDPEVSKYLGDGKPVADIETTERFLAKFIEHENRWGFSPWAVVHRQTEKVIGICGPHTFNANQEPEIGFRFLRSHWGQGFATEASNACVHFLFSKFNSPLISALTDEKNIPTQQVLTNVGFKLVGPSQDERHARRYLRYERTRDLEKQPYIETARLLLEPITVGHARELVDLFADPQLHTFVPFEPPTFEQQSARCRRWAIGQSPDGEEVWLNWAARDKSSGLVVGHFQSGIKKDLTASVGYVVAKSAQGKGYAFEAMTAVFEVLQKRFAVKAAKAWTDTRNLASHRLAMKLQMKNIGTIQNADFFKGETSHEFVFAKELG